MRFLKSALLCTVVLLCLLPFSALAQESDNLLYNGSFDILGSDGLPDGWYTDAYVRQEGYTVWEVSEDARTGQYSALVNNLGMNDARFAQTVRVEPESMYCLSGWIKADQILDAGRGANLSIEGLYVFSESIFDSEGEWLYIETYGETGEDQKEVTIFARVGGYSGESEGLARFDDLSLRKVDSLPDGVIADLWFKLDTPVVQADAFESESAAAPFWPWLLVISVAYAALGVMGLRQMQLDRRTLTEGKRAPAVLIVGLVLAAAARLMVAMMVEGYEVDVNCFTSWGYTMAQVGPTMFYQSTSFCDYTPAYIYIMGLAGTVAGWLQGIVHASVIHKLVPMACDLAMAWLLYRFAREQRMSRKQSAVLGLLFAFNPAMFINSAAWCQIDSALCLCLMLVAYLALKRQWAAALPVYVLSALIKPQAFMLGFLGLAAILMDQVQRTRPREKGSKGNPITDDFRRNRDVRLPLLIGVGISAVLAAMVVIPFSIHQSSGTWLIDLYGKTLASYPYATVNTANIFYLFGANWKGIDLSAGWLALTIFAALALIWGLYTFLRLKGRKLRLLEPVLMACFALAFLAGLAFDASWTYLGTLSMAMAFAVVLPMFIRSGKMENLPLCGAVLFILLYVLGIKMHERYLFPALILLAMAYALRRDPRTLVLLLASTCTLFVNEGIVLDNSVRLGSSMGHLNNDTLVLNNVVSVINVCMALLSVWTCHGICVENAPESLAEKVEPLLPIRRYTSAPCTVRNFKTDASLYWKPLDWVLMLSVTAVYAVVCLTTLGSAKAPQNPWKSTAKDEAVIIDLGEDYTDFSMLYFAQVSYSDFSVAVSDDGQSWSEEYWAQMAQGQCFRWKYLVPSWESEGTHSYAFASHFDSVQKLTGRYVRLTAQQIGLILNEVIFKDAQGEIIPASVVEAINARSDSPNYSDPTALLDEQNTLEGEPGWWNSTYFDEIYHARTAFEHMNGTVPYETSHPPLGKVFMSWAVAALGMTPFGWRFAGAMAGVLMLPAMYLLGKQLTKKTSLAFAAMTMMTLDCMHFTQTRIATIDSFPVLFIIVSYFFMLRFMQRDITLEPMRKLLPDLALSGLFMGLGMASKWIGVYAGAGLALMYFWTLARHIRLSLEARKVLAGREGLSAKEREALEKRARTAMRRCIDLCLWCLLFFVTVPVIIYLLSYIPYFAYAHKDGLMDYLGMVIRAQEGMLNYHSKPGLGMDHPFYSPWYEWPLIQRPMYYASPSFVPEGWSYAIFCFGNPAVWLVGLGCLGVTAFVWARRHRYAIEGQSMTLHPYASSWSVAPAFVLIGLLAQFLPWVLVPRGTYIYHYFASIPFLIVATILALHWLMEARPKLGKAVLAAYLLVCLVFFIAYFPYASGVLTPTWWLDFMKQFLRIYY